MILANESIVTVYADTMAAILLFGLIIVSNRFSTGKDKNASKLYLYLCVMVLINAVSNAISYAFHHQVLNVPQFVKCIAPTISEVSALIALFIWMLYVDYKIYGSWDRLKFKYRKYRIPLVIFEILSVVNLFTGIMFTMDENTMFVAKPLFYVMTFLQYFYGCVPVYTIIKYHVTRGRLHFFHITPVAGPVIISSLFTLFTPYSARAFGFAIALVFLHLSYVDAWRFDDFESGFFNSHYINYILTEIGDKKRDYKSAITFFTYGDPRGLFDILKKEVPKDGEVIRMDEDRFLLFSPSSKGSMQKVLTDIIKEEAEEHDSLHPEQPIVLTIDYKVRKKKETPEEFVRNVSGRAD